MGKLTVTHEICCDADTFWETFFDERYNKELFLEHLGYAEHRIVEKRETDAEIVRKVVAKPRLSVPGPIAKLIGDNFRYTEEGVFDKAARIWRFKVIPSVQADKVRTEGTVRVEPAGGERVRRVAEITVEARIFGVGGLVESSSEKQVQKSMEEGAAFMNDYLRRAAR
jgi:Protein of unknown function (DUF2505)